jgi:hypothetical protein
MFSDKNGGTYQPWNNNSSFSDSSNISCFKGNKVPYDLEPGPGRNRFMKRIKKNLKSTISCQTIFKSGQFFSGVRGTGQSK